MLRWLEPEEQGVDKRKWDNSPSRVLVENVQEFTMSVRENFWSEWKSNWEESAIAPAVVRLQIKSSDRFWPELIMQVQR